MTSSLVDNDSDQSDIDFKVKENQNNIGLFSSIVFSAWLFIFHTCTYIFSQQFFYLLLFLLLYLGGIYFFHVFTSVAFTICNIILATFKIARYLVI